MVRKGKLVQAVAYMRTSSATNVGADKDSEARQRRVISSYAKRAGLVLVDANRDDNHTDTVTYDARYQTRRRYR
jgi:hypothetical protein